MRLFSMLALSWGAASAALPPALAQTREGTLTVDGRLRTYRLHLPQPLPTGTRHPLVLVFHGGLSDAKAMEQLSQFDPLADREGFFVVYPDGVDRNWYDGRVVPDSRAHRERIDDVHFVTVLLDTLAESYPIDPRAVYATGISNGAIFSHFLAIHLAQRIAAIAPVAGGIADSAAARFAPRAPVSLIIFQGTADPLLPYEGGGVRGGRRGYVIGTDSTIRLWTHRDGLAGPPVVSLLPDTDPQDGCTVRRSVWQGGRDGAAVVLYQLQGGGHTWPGGKQYLPKLLIGPVCRDFDATATIWTFFKAHPRTPTGPSN